MFVICFVVAMACCYVVEQTFHNFYITVGLAGLMAVSSAILCARDERKQREGHGEG